MSDKSKYTIFELKIPGYLYIKPNVNVLCETVHEIWKSKFIIFDGSHFEYCNKIVEASTSQVASIKILK